MYLIKSFLQVRYDLNYATIDTEESETVQQILPALRAVYANSIDSLQVVERLELIIEKFLPNSKSIIGIKTHTLLTIVTFLVMRNVYKIDELSHENDINKFVPILSILNTAKMIVTSVKKNSLTSSFIGIISSQKEVRITRMIERLRSRFSTFSPRLISSVSVEQNTVHKNCLVKKLNRFSSVEKLLDDAPDKQCMVCFTAMDTNTKFAVLSNCRHIFCLSCTVNSFTYGK